MLAWRQLFVIKKKKGKVDCLSQTCRKENLPEHNTKHSSPQSNNECFSQRPPLSAKCPRQRVFMNQRALLLPGLWKTIVISKVSIHDRPETVFLGLSGFCNANVFSGDLCDGPQHLRPIMSTNAKQRRWRQRRH